MCTCEAGRWRSREEKCEDADCGTKRQLQCSSCPHGYHQPAEDAAKCIPCSAGHYSDDDSRVAEPTCTACPAGKYGSESGQMSCTTCPVAKFQMQAGKSYCDELQPGQVIEGTVVSEDELREEAARNFARVLTELTGTPFRISVVKRFTAQRSHLTPQALTSQALILQASIDRMHQNMRDAGQAISAMLGNQWPQEGGDAILISVLLGMTRSVEEADARISRVLLNAMIQTTTRPAQRSKPKSAPPIVKTPGVTVVDLSESSSGDA